MKFHISPQVHELFPSLRIGVLVAEGIENASVDKELIKLKFEKAGEFRNKYNPNTLLDNVCIKAWRDTYRKFGVNAKDHKPTAEALLRRLLKGEDIPSISKAVDLYLVVETQFYLPIGGYDLDHIQGDIQLRLSPGGEDFIPLGSTQVEEQTSPNEVVYSDDVRILTRRWNYRDCDKCKITKESKRITLFTEAALPEISTEHLSSSLDLLREYMLQYCGGSVKTMLIDSNKSLTWELL